MTTETETLLNAILVAQLDGNELTARLMGGLIVLAFLLMLIALWPLRGKI